MSKPSRKEIRPRFRYSPRSNVVIKNPEITKNVRTPRSPATSRCGMLGRPRVPLACANSTIAIEIARSPSSPGIRPCVSLNNTDHCGRGPAGAQPATPARHHASHREPAVGICPDRASPLVGRAAGAQPCAWARNAGGRSRSLDVALRRASRWRSRVPVWRIDDGGRDPARRDARALPYRPRHDPRPARALCSRDRRVRSRAGAGEARRSDVASATIEAIRPGGMSEFTEVCDGSR